MKVKKYDKDYFKHIGYYDNPYNKQLVKLLTKIKKDGNLLEIGCAEGLFLHHAEEYYDCTGIDISKYGISKAKRNLKKSRLYLGDVQNDLPNLLREKKYDIIVASDILEHLSNPNETLKIINNLLKSDGIFIFRVPNLRSLDLKIKKILGIKEEWAGNRDKTHISMYDLNKWIQLLNDNSFNYKLLPYFPTKKAKKYIAKYFPSLFFLPSFLHWTNDSITFYCTKK